MAWWGRARDWLSERIGVGRSLVPREPVSLRPIGVVRNSVREPRMDGWENVRSDIIIRDDLAPMLEGIEGYSHVIVVFAFHRLPPPEPGRTHVRPRGDESLPEQGILATRSQLRPAPVGVTVAELMRRRRNILRVRGLDAIDGTPVLDIKPYYPGYDAVPAARVPDWALLAAAEPAKRPPVR